MDEQKKSRAEVLLELPCTIKQLFEAADAVQEKIIVNKEGAREGFRAIIQSIMTEPPFKYTNWDMDFAVGLFSIIGSIGFDINIPDNDKEAFCMLLAEIFPEKDSELTETIKMDIPREANQKPAFYLSLTPEGIKVAESILPPKLIEEIKNTKGRDKSKEGKVDVPRKPEENRIDPAQIVKGQDKS